ncbi:MAG: hypothetical protein QG628_840 [Patescibacteria group bacterium]|nr:hypothetical protein [Patescibacteria group bacterium]
MNMQAIQIRQATTQDISRIKEILDGAVSHKLLRGDSSWGFIQYEGDPLEKSVTNGSAYVATSGDEIVGTFVLVGEDKLWGPQPPEAAYLQRLAVDYHFHRRNIGAQIIGHAGQEGKKFGRTLLRLTCPSGNTKLCAYYEKLGFIRADSKATPPPQLKPTAFFEKQV